MLRVFPSLRRLSVPTLATRGREKNTLPRIVSPSITVLHHGHPCMWPTQIVVQAPPPSPRLLSFSGFIARFFCWVRFYYIYDLRFETFPFAIPRSSPSFCYDISTFACYHDICVIRQTTVFSHHLFQISTPSLNHDQCLVLTTSTSLGPRFALNHRGMLADATNRSMKNFIAQQVSS